MEKIAIRLRTCMRCGHQECPCCRDNCDTSIPILGDDEARRTMCDCLQSKEGRCLYDEPVDEEGYARLDAATERAGIPYGISSDPPHGVIVTSHDEELAADAARRE